METRAFRLVSQHIGCLPRAWIQSRCPALLAESFDQYDQYGEQWGEDGYESEESVSENLANGGRLETLQWAIADGCPCGPAVTTAALHRGHTHVLDWLKTRDFFVCPTQDAYTEVLKDALVESAKWLHENALPLEDPEFHYQKALQPPRRIHLARWIRETYNIHDIPAYIELQ